MTSHSRVSLRKLAMLYISSTVLGCAIACFPIFLAWGIVEAQTVQVSNHDSVFPTATPQATPWRLNRKEIHLDSSFERLISYRKPAVTKEGGKWVITFSENKKQLEAATPKGQAQR